MRFCGFSNLSCNEGNDASDDFSRNMPGRRNGFKQATTVDGVLVLGMLWLRYTIYSCSLIQYAKANIPQHDLVAASHDGHILTATQCQ